MPKKSTAVRQSGRTNQLIPWGLGLVGSIGATDNYKIKVLNNSVILPQMASDGGNPFYFGGSQVPFDLGVKGNTETSTSLPAKQTIKSRNK
jgi:hypothetical protein